MKQQRYSDEELERIAELYDEGNVGQKTYQQIADEINEEFFNSESIRSANSISYGVQRAIEEGYL